MSSIKLSFKKQVPTGAFSSFSLEHHEIKADGKVVGSIGERRQHAPGERFMIMLQLKREPTPDDPCSFTNRVLTKKFPTAEAAREFVRAKWDAIIAMGLRADE